MKRAALCILALLTVPSQAMAIDPASGDFFLISRHSDGAFHASHKLFHRKADGLHKVSYCGRDLWVRPYTVAWTQNEVKNRRVVQVEYNGGRGWHPVCGKAEDQVRLADLGIDMGDADYLNNGAGYQARKSRFNIIMKAFSKGY